MNVNKKWNRAELLKACRDYQKVTGRRISFEYAMIKGVNDTNECAMELAKILKGIMCHVNLIPVNANKGVLLFTALATLFKLLNNSRRLILNFIFLFSFYLFLFSFYNSNNNKFCGFVDNSLFLLSTYLL